MAETKSMLRGDSMDGTGNSGGLQGPYEGSQPNLRMLQHSNSSTSISALQEAHAYQADMLRAQVLASHASGSNLHVPSYIRPAGTLTDAGSVALKRAMHVRTFARVEWDGALTKCLYASPSCKGGSEGVWCPQVG